MFESVRVRTKLIFLSVFPLSLFTGLIVLSPFFAHKWFVFFGIIAIVLIAAVGFLIINSIVAPLQRLQNSIEESARNSDLTLKAPILSCDSIGTSAKAFNAMLEKFHDIVLEVKQANSKLVEAAKVLSATTLKSRDGMYQQQQEIDNVSNATQNMTNTFEGIAKNAMEAFAAAKNAIEEAQKGGLVIETTLKSISQLANDVERVSVVIKRVDNDSKEIGIVLDVIKSIAEKTNLLSLNAAIEAARAGEQGRGFAVVADEVRTLAKRTQQSTEEIHNMIDRLQSGVKDAVEVMSEGRQRAQKNVEKATKAGEYLQTIKTKVDIICDLNSHIATSTEEHNQVTKEISYNLENINQLSTHYTEVADDTAKASKDIENIAKNLQQMVTIFKV